MDRKLLEVARKIAKVDRGLAKELLVAAKQETTITAKSPELPEKYIKAILAILLDNYLVKKLDHRTAIDQITKTELKLFKEKLGFSWEKRDISDKEAEKKYLALQQDMTDKAISQIKKMKLEDIVDFEAAKKDWNDDEKSMWKNG